MLIQPLIQPVTEKQWHLTYLHFSHSVMNHYKEQAIESIERSCCKIQMGSSMQDRLKGVIKTMIYYTVQN